jgi:hypothetical protein
MVNGITTNLYHAQALQHGQQFRAAFQKLGHDLKSGDVATAQNDFAMLINSAPTPADLSQLDTDLQNGNLSAAQQDYKAIQRSHGELHSSALETLTSSVASAASAYATGGPIGLAGAVLNALG